MKSYSYFPRHSLLLYPCMFSTRDGGLLTHSARVAIHPGPTSWHTVFAFNENAHPSLTRVGKGWVVAQVCDPLSTADPVPSARMSLILSDQQSTSKQTSRCGPCRATPTAQPRQTALSSDIVSRPVRDYARERSRSFRGGIGSQPR